MEEDRPWGGREPEAVEVGHREGRFYPVMEFEELAELPVSEWAEERAHLWMWSMNGTLETACRLIRAWGFERMNLVTWCKTSSHDKDVFGMGVYMRLNTEQLLFATRGKPALRPEKPWLGSSFRAPRLEHSVKPDKAYEIVEHVSPGPRLELFARREREGWTSWGNDVQPVNQLPLEGLAR